MKASIIAFTHKLHNQESSTQVMCVCVKMMSNLMMSTYNFMPGHMKHDSGYVYKITRAK